MIEGKPAWYSDPAQVLAEVEDMREQVPFLWARVLDAGERSDEQLVRTQTVYGPAWGEWPADSYHAVRTLSAHLESARAAWSHAVEYLAELEQVLAGVAS